MALPTELATRIAAAKLDRSRHQDAINDFLRLADPVRPRIGDSATTTTRAEEASDLYDDTLQQVADDFASDTLHRMMPREAPWVAYEPVSAIPEEVARALQDPLKDRSKAIFDAVTGSNFYSEAGAEWAFDLGHGTAAMICNDYGNGEPLCFEGIGPHQLLIERGAKGKLSLKAREFTMPLEEAVAQWRGAKWPAKLIRESRQSSTKRKAVICIEAATRIYDPGDEMWKWQVCVDGHVIIEDTLVGIGSCPIIVTRWRSISTTAWGIGPLRKALANGKSLDQVAYLRLKNMGKACDPVTVYDDDGVLNPEGGVGPGMWIPRLPGSKIEQLDGANLNTAYYETGLLQDSVRRAGYQNGPDQKGKTPPTAFQWREEQLVEGRRLEQPTGKLYEEGVIAILNRVEYLLVERGEIEEVIDAGKQAIRVRPKNPLAKQQEGEKVQNASNLLSVFRASFGDQAVSATVDTVATIENFKRAVDDEIIALREPGDANEMMRGVLGQPGMAPGLETAPGGMPPQ
jgi:hypothetical protein